LVEAVMQEPWRLLPSRYAEHMSDGKWIRYAWIAFVMERVRERVLAGNARIVINAPPRHGKSHGLSFWFPAWYLSLFPDRRVILASYGDHFAARWGRMVRDHLRDHEESEVEISKEQHAAADWMTTEGGGMRSVGVGGAITGQGGNLILLDDPHKDWEEALSPTYRRRFWDWFLATLYTRLEPGGSLVVIQTRWHEDDATGKIFDEHTDEWEHICIPAIAEENDALGREEGESLCPERFPAAKLAQIKEAVTSYMFAGLYQQRPAPLEGGTLKRDWFGRYTDLPTSFDQMLQSWDLTFKSTGSSYVVGQVWGRKDADFYLAHQVRDRLDFPGTLRAIERVSKQWPDVTTKLVEEAANGHAVIATLRDKVPGIVGVKPAGSKEARLVAVSGLVESGNVWIPEQSVASWADDFIEEAVVFPNGANDDQVDAMTMALSRLRTQGPGFKMDIPDGGQRPSPWSI
jgi:predicted phage terminase large subunit-like protein